MQCTNQVSQPQRIRPTPPHFANPLLAPRAASPTKPPLPSHYYHSDSHLPLNRKRN
jgi:hypothetical protein